MARGIRLYDAVRDGTLDVKESSPDIIEVYFTPPERSLRAANRDPSKARSYRAKLLEIDSARETLTIHPICTFGERPNFLKPKYAKVKQITLETQSVVVPWADAATLMTLDGILEVLEALPPTFTKDYAYGLGLAKPYRFILDAVEELSDSTEIVIGDKHPTGTDPEGNAIFFIAATDFEQMRLELDKIERHTQNASRSVKRTVSHNILAEKIGVPLLEVSTGRHPYRKLFTSVAQGSEEQLSEKDQNAVIGALTNHAEVIAKDQPEKLAKLRGDIELVTLEALIGRYDQMLRQVLEEELWQNFFNENPFILNMAFGYPVIKVRDQASVGGRKLSGGGEKITDFLVKNSLTNNTAIFEIKTPQTPILNKTPFRDGVYTPAGDLSGSINQALDQKYQFQKQIAQIKDNTRLYDIESYAVHCCLVIGKTPDGDDRKKSFELFRRNSKDVEIVTFDELLEKLKQLSTFLRSAEDAN